MRFLSASESICEVPKGTVHHWRIHMKGSHPSIMVLTEEGALWIAWSGGPFGCVGHIEDDAVDDFKQWMEQWNNHALAPEET